MSGPDWCRWYPNRWITGTIQLTLEQRGFFVQVVSVIMDLGSCEADPAYLARICNCQPRRAERLRNELVALGKLEHNGEKLLNERAIVERSLAERLSTNGRLRAAKRWNNNDITDAGQQCKPQPHKKEQERLERNVLALSPPPESLSASSRPNGRRNKFEDFWSHWTIPGTKRGRAAAERKYLALIRSGEATNDELCAGVDRYMAWCRRERKETTFIKEPATWLNKGCWTDELAPGSARAGPSTPPRNGGDRIAELLAVGSNK